MSNYTYFNKTGELLLKNKIDVIEYHLYNSKIPQSIDINETLDTYLYSNTNQPIHITIENEEYKFSETGFLTKAIVDGVDKYYLDTDMAVFDIETILFFNTELINTIKIKSIIKSLINNINNIYEDDDAEYGGNDQNETREKS